MVYGPCGSWNLWAPYIVALGLGLPLTCLKRYPKPFNPTTVVYIDSYLEYRRCNNLRLWSVRLPGPIRATFEIDNRWVILYSPYLTIKYYMYINIKVCASVKSVKYIYKYIYKGNDRTTL
jgi:hypothetical protein